MKGIHRIIIQNKRIRYDFELRRNLTVLRGDSATGKTALIDLVREYTDNGEASSIELTCDKRCYVLEGATWVGQLSVIKDSIVFIDEGNPFVLTNEFARIIKATDNYYVIVTREGLPNLPYSVEEIYGIRMSGKYAGLKKTYNEFYRIYGKKNADRICCPETVITEDSNAGYEFFCNVCSENRKKCISAEGKSNFVKKLREMPDDQKILLVADGAAFGPEMDRVMKFLQARVNTVLYVPESFEWLVLSANPMNDRDIRLITEVPWEYIESEKYFSWERYFTELLTEKTKGTYLQYTKSKLNPSYLTDNVRKAVLEEMPDIQFK